MTTGHEQGPEHALLAAVALAADRLLANSDHLQLSPVLEALGTAANLSRASLVAAHIGPDGAPRMESRQQWTAPGIARLQPSIDGWPRYPERWAAELQAGRPIAAIAGGLPADERAHLESVGIRSMLLTPIHTAGEWYGHLACHDAQTSRTWTAHEVAAMATIAGIVGQAIGQRRLVASLDHRAGLLRAIGTGSSMLLEASNWRQALPRVLDTLRTATRSRSAWAYGPDPDAPGRRAVLLYEVLAPGARALGGRSRVLELGAEAAARLQVTGPVHAAQPADVREPLGSVVAQAGVPSWAIAPMVIALGHVGLVGLDSEAERRWTDGETEGLEAVASALKAAIRRGSQLAPIAIVPSPWGQPAAIPLGGAQAVAEAHAAGSSAALGASVPVPGAAVPVARPSVAAGTPIGELVEDPAGGEGRASQR